MNGKLIVLNGASSAGKTTIAHALIPRMGDGVVFTSFDHILEREKPLGDEGDLMRFLRVLRFQLTDGRLRLFRQLHREVADLVRGGSDVILETALMDRRALLDAASQFAPLGGCFVGIKPPLEVSEQWEAQRGDRPRGQARLHYDLIHAHGHYDLVIDPSVHAPDVCAEMILAWMDAPCDAFARLGSA